MENEQGEPRPPEWFPEILKSAGLQLPCKVGEVFAATDKIANRLAPNTRKAWLSLLWLQGFAVASPLLWLLVEKAGLPTTMPAFVVMCCTLLLVGMCWWLRWRGMQQDWIRNRLVAEIARSEIATRETAPGATFQALASSPSLQPIASALGSNAEMATSGNVACIADYVERRIDDQIAYYESKMHAAENERWRHSQLATRALDGALFLAAAGTALSLSEQARVWFRIAGSDYLLAFVGVGLPLVAVLIQLFGSQMELNRRIGRFSRQIEFLHSAKSRLAVCNSLSEALPLINEVERGLLGEVIDWFYQSKTAELYYRRSRSGASRTKTHKGLDRPDASLMSRIATRVGTGLAFLIAVLFGRVLVVTLSAILTTALIAYWSPSDPVSASKLSEGDGRLLSSPEADSWTPNQLRASQGFVLIAHGLRDGVEAPGTESWKEHWMRELQEAIKERRGFSSPEICLLDWRDAANPRLISGGAGGIGWGEAICAIRPQAEQIGQLAGCKIALAIQSGKIDPQKPMHFIGHSAGGFVVLHTALVMKRLGIRVPNWRITMLDTPMPVASDMQEIAEVAKLDFYVTSEFTAVNVPESNLHPNYTKFVVTAPAEMSATEKHSFAHQWFIKTVKDPKNSDERGFARSPLAE